MPPHAQSTADALRSAEVHVDVIAKYDNWDARECAVSNADAWRERANSFVSSHGGNAPIPCHIHQIWIGTREPPCVWLDSWRLDFMATHGAGWTHTLWDNDAVAAMRAEEELENADLFDREQMWQCKADLLRLELLYRFGGVYIDADLISLGKPLDAVLEMSCASGFGVSYEADTKDKPYSVLGNSIIFASKGHPLLALLIRYIRRIYDHKRPHYGVEWVSGPLAFSKALLHAGMPLTMIPREYFYPTFHYIPNPSAIDPAAFPDSLGFQFGYTCSNLGEWVRTNNKCKKALDCPYHKKRTDYPFGAIKPFAAEEDCVEDGQIPKIIHQFCFSTQPPTRWIDTWAQKFCMKRSDWTHKLWTYEELVKEKSYFCAHMYPEVGRHMDEETMRLLVLEILFKHGGILCAANYTVHIFWRCVCLSSHFYALGKHPKVLSTSGQCSEVVEMGRVRLSCIVPSIQLGSRFSARVALSSLLLVITRLLRCRALCFLHIDAQVPCYPYDSKSLPGLLETNESVVVITDANVMKYQRVVDEIAGLIYKTEQQDSEWDYITTALEWSTGCNDEIVERAHVPYLRESVHCFGVIVNAGRCARLAGCDAAGLIETVLRAHDSSRVYVGTVRFEEDESVSAVLTAMPVIRDVFLRIAGHPIPSWECDEREVHGRLLKGVRGGRLAYEVSVDDERRIMFRAFNDDNGMNCEARIAQGFGGHHVVEHARVYFDHTIVYEGNQCLVTVNFEYGNAPYLERTEMGVTVVCVVRMTGKPTQARAMPTGQHGCEYSISLR
eukprot:IDg13204t1